MANEAMAYVRETLTPEKEIEERTECVGRLKVVALALGAEKTRTELLPFLKKLCEFPSTTMGEAQVRAGPEVGDEVLTELAEELGKFELETVGGKAHAHLLLEPLIALCSIDETAVRSTAVKSINALGKSLSPEQLFQHLAPKTMELFENSEWFVPRVSACGLCAVAYRGCKECKPSESRTVNMGDKERTWKADELAKELASAYRKMFSDPEPMVRRAASRSLAETAEAFGEETTRIELVEVFAKLIDETEQESIRVSSLASAAAIFRVAPIAEGVDPGDKYIKCASDKSWRVRVAVSESISAVARERKDHPDELERCQDIFMNLLKDQEAEVRHATAAQSAAAASVLGSGFTVANLVPEVKDMVRDEGVVNRVELAGVLLEMAGPIGMPHAADVYTNESSTDGMLLRVLLVDEANTNLRLTVIGKLPALIDVLTISQCDPVLEIIQTLIGDKNWRIRHAALMLLPTLANQMEVGVFNENFIQEQFTARAEDNCALIRNDWVVCCKSIGDVYGREWAVAHILPKLSPLSAHKNYQLKAVFLHAAYQLGPLLTPDILASQFMPVALDMASDRVPNLRLTAAYALGQCASGGWVSSSFTKEKIVPLLNKLANEDADVDVKANAVEALELIG